MMWMWMGLALAADPAPEPAPDETPEDAADEAVETPPPTPEFVFGGSAVEKEVAKLNVKRRVAPTYPIEALTLGVQSSDCVVRVFIEDDGVPYELEYDDCHPYFQPTTSETVARWRWYPPEYEGTPVKGQWLMNVRYKLREEVRGGGELCTATVEVGGTHTPAVDGHERCRLDTRGDLPPITRPCTLVVGVRAGKVAYGTQTRGCELRREDLAQYVENWKFGKGTPRRAYDAYSVTIEPAAE